MKHVCDAKWDCPHGEDEDSCQEFHCSGLFWCPIEMYCLSFLDICDGKVDCEQTAIDEQFCNMAPCPKKCFCVGYAVSCIDRSLRNIPKLGRRLIILVFRKNRMTHLKSSKSLTSIEHLDLSFNYFSSLEKLKEVLKDIKFLNYFNIASNRIQSLGTNVFLSQNKLRYLNISYNPIKSISKSTFSGLSGINQFKLTKTVISSLCDYCLARLTEVFYLEITFNLISFIARHAFANMTRLKHIVLENNKIKQVDIVLLEVLDESTVFKTDVSALCCDIKKAVRSYCTNNKTIKSFCLSWYMQLTWYCYVSVGLFFNILGLLIDRGNENDIFSVLVQNLSLSQVFLALHYSLRIFINYGTIRTIIFSGRKLMTICKVSAIIFPMSQLTQVFLQFLYSFFYLLLVVYDHWLPKLRKVYFMCILVWILSLLLPCTLLDTRYMFEDLCLMYCSTDNLNHNMCSVWIFTYVMIVGVLGHDVILIYAIFKAAEIKKFSKSKETKQEVHLRRRITLQIIISSFHFVFVGIVYAMISSLWSMNQALLASMDYCVFMKSISVSMLYTLTVMSKWKKVRKKCHLCCSPSCTIHK